MAFLFFFGLLDYEKSNRRRSRRTRHLLTYHLGALMKLLSGAAFYLALLFFLVGCNATSPKSSAPTYSYYEIIDKSEFLSGSSSDYMMHWERINEYCNATVRQQAQNRGYHISSREMRGTYNNCKAVNNFRLIPSSQVRDIADRNKEKYGETFVIERTWPAE